ncbi:hypothetical protein FOZ63_017030 [Perkinsus olseni]|uniref:Uncharacterized protein n=1 Tax=Perkinsus olseni TaxID=32597 RepID=A0A7J6UMC7_PEROL|nr:hypothetical protein FOZ63_017030 [Perkinsus olseni]
MTQYHCQRGLLEAYRTTKTPGCLYTLFKDALHLYPDPRVVVVRGGRRDQWTTPIGMILTRVTTSIGMVALLKTWYVEVIRTIETAAQPTDVVTSPVAAYRMSSLARTTTTRNMSLAPAMTTLDAEAGMTSMLTTTTRETGTPMREAAALALSHGVSFAKLRHNGTTADSIYRTLQEDAAILGYRFGSPEFVNYLFVRGLRNLILELTLWC